MLFNNQNTRDIERKKERQKALLFLKSNAPLTAQEICSEAGVSRSIYYKLRTCVKRNDEEQLSSLLDPMSNRAGRKRILSDDEEEMICERLKFAASRGFAVEDDDVKQLMVQISLDGQKDIFGDSLPSDDLIRSFRTRHRDITYRSSEDKDLARIRGENYEHVKTYANLLSQINQDFPGMLHDPDRVWNTDETAVSAENSIAKKAFTTSDSHHGGFKCVSTRKGPGKHITAVIAVSASGRIAPPFLIVAGKNVMARWFIPLDKALYKFEEGNLFSLARKIGSPSDGCVVMSGNGSMEKALIPIFIEHLDRFVRKHVPASLDYLLCLDGHSSRKGVE